VNKLLIVEGVTKRFGNRCVLDDVTFSVCSAEILGLIVRMGPARLLPVNAGTIRFHEKTCRHLAANRRGRGVHHRNFGVLHDGAGLIDHDDDHRRRVGRLRSDWRCAEGKKRNEKQRPAESIIGCHFDHLVVFEVASTIGSRPEADRSELAIYERSGVPKTSEE
jgi:hypothetical protein